MRLQPQCEEQQDFQQFNTIFMRDPMGATPAVGLGYRVCSFFFNFGGAFPSVVKNVFALFCYVLVQRNDDCSAITLCLLHQVTTS